MGAAEKLADQAILAWLRTPHPAPSFDDVTSVGIGQTNARGGGPAWESRDSYGAWSVPSFSCVPSFSRTSPRKKLVSITVKCRRETAGCG